MADSRFGWSRVDKLSGAIELKNRAEADSRLRRRAQKDSKIQCWACGKRIRRSEEVYYPAVGLTSSNKIAGHVQCIDEMVAKIPGKENLAKSLPTVSREHSHPVIKGDVESFYSGWYAGVRSVFDQRKPDSFVSDPEWLRGFYEGSTYAIDHRS